jgi:hypothetical protein
MELTCDKERERKFAPALVAALLSSDSDTRLVEAYPIDFHIDTASSGAYGSYGGPSVASCGEPARKASPTNISFPTEFVETQQSHWIQGNLRN